jgi:hypothetical protein
MEKREEQHEPRVHNNKRITVLSEAEKHALYGLPGFDDFQRAEYFAMTEAEHALAFQRTETLKQLYCRSGTSRRSTSSSASLCTMYYRRTSHS